MNGRPWSVLSFLTVILALQIGWAASVTRVSPVASPGPTMSAASESVPSRRLLLEENETCPAISSKVAETLSSASPCANAFVQRAVCVAANRRALEIMNSIGLEAFTVVQDVRTGALNAFAASRPSSLDVTTPVLPLSLSKLLLAASWWDNRQPDALFDSPRGKANAQNPASGARVSVHEMLVGGSDSAGRQIALALRRSVGTETVLKDFNRYGFSRGGTQVTDSQRDNTFWAELAPAWAARLVPAAAYAALSNQTIDSEWADTLSIGEANMMVTGLHISRFLQAIGNGGVMLFPSAREEQPGGKPQPPPAGAGQGLLLANKTLNMSSWQLGKKIRVMKVGTALRLQAAMRDAVQRGTATSIANTLADTGWQIGGKTGSGPGPAPIGPQSDGWFAGLIFDGQGKARFTVATFVRHGGRGGNNAAKISAEVARYLIGGNPASGMETSEAGLKKKAPSTRSIRSARGATSRRRIFWRKEVSELAGNLCPKAL